MKKDFQDIVLSARQDDFYQRHMYANFGDMGTAVKELVDAFQSHTATTKNVATIEDMQNFVENFSEFSAAQRNAGKHVTLMSELSRVVDARMLMQARRARPAVGRRAVPRPSSDVRCRVWTGSVTPGGCGAGVQHRAGRCVQHRQPQRPL